MKIFVASSNAHKIAEIAQILPEFTVLSASAIAPDFAPEESGETFAQNAMIKARALAAYAPADFVLADDSGLCVDALRGAPGVFSARFAAEQNAGAPGDDEANKTALKAALARAGVAESRAEFVCAIALVRGEQSAVCEGKMPGAVKVFERGAGGFGYDAMFFADAGGGRSNAELSAEEKNAISHRAAALGELKKLLQIWQKSATGGAETERTGLAEIGDKPAAAGSTGGAEIGDKREAKTGSENATENDNRSQKGARQ